MGTTIDKSKFTFVFGDSLSEIISLSADAIISTDENRNIVLFNKAAQTLFEYSEEEILGEPLDILLPEYVKDKHQKYLSEFDRSKKNARRMGERKPVSGISKSGKEIFLDISILKHPSTSMLTHTAICRDFQRFWRIKTVWLKKKRNSALFLMRLINW